MVVPGFIIAKIPKTVSGKHRDDGAVLVKEIFNRFLVYNILRFFIFGPKFAVHIAAQIRKEAREFKLIK